ncbi:MAG: PQQ-dependent sugar dehydrogenase [Acidimicrobiia bacterium]|nr:PQQ-dependent sugar dehydrogenase [Acidimicrobiia bacterium]
MSHLRVAAAIGLAVLLAAACTAVEEVEDTSAGVEDGAVEAPPPAPPAETTVPAATLAGVTVTATEIASLNQPTAMAVRTGDPAIYVAEKGGTVRRIAVETDRDGERTFTVERTAALDISDEVIEEGEQGLLGLTFSTDGNRMYVAYTGLDARQYLAAYPMGEERAEADERTEVLVIGDFAPNHNGGQLVFGPDGFLYWGMGDGGGSGDPQGTGQDPGDLLGNILRIDSDVAPEAADDVTYAIPDANPFAGGGGAPEVWAYGLRNPWRFSFDAEAGDLWIADVGEGDVEEINLLPAAGGGGRGANLGWSLVEGDRPFQGGAAPPDAVAPVFTYDHGAGGCSVTGGFVYRGERIPALVGAYLYADFCIGRVRALRLVDGAVAEDADLGLDVAGPTSFGQDDDGELYVLSLDGPVLRIDPVAPPPG